MKKKRVLSLLLSTVIVAGMLQTGGAAVFADEKAKLVAHYTFDGTAEDASGNGNNGTAVGNLDYVQGPLGKAAVFDGNTYIEVPDSDSLDLGRDFTFSVWLYSNPVDADGGRLTSKQVILTKQGSSGNESIPAYSVEKYGMKPFLQRYDTGDIGSGGGGEEAGKMIEDHKWELLTITYDGSDIKFYQNGEILSTVESGGGSPLQTSAGKLFIGTGEDGSYNGRMDDLRIYNGALSQAEVKDLYLEAAKGANKDLVIRPDRMIAYYSFNKDANDCSGFENNGTEMGNISYVNTIASKGAKFDGSSYIDVKDSDILEVDKGFSVSAWMKLEDPKKELYIQPLVTKLESDYNLDVQSYMMAINPVYYPYFDFYGFPDGGGYSKSDSSLLPGSWGMVTMTYTADEIRFYYNGKLVKSEEVKAGDIVHSAGKLVIGKLLVNGGTYFTKGILDELRLYNYSLSDKGVKKLYSCRDSLAVTAPKNVKKDSLNVKQTVQLTTYLSTYVFSPSNSVPGTGKDTFNMKKQTSGVSYKSSAPKTVSVDSQGKITALAKGKAKIIISCGELSTSVSVTVK